LANFEIMYQLCLADHDRIKYKVISITHFSIVSILNI